MTIEQLLQMLERAEMAEEVTLPVDKFRELVELAIKALKPDAHLRALETWK
jgi:hypothetical protein